ncbi:MAG: hypothetical protein GC184_06685 [Rhizobiales bacterium]|nr:hypothetical protein [Hyphomicrobiales bacterium]
MESEAGEANGWHLDKRVPIAMIVAIIIQSGAGLVWAGAASERLVSLEGRSLRTDEVVERTARLEEQSHAMRASLARIEDKLDRAVAGRR